MDLDVFYSLMAVISALVPTKISERAHAEWYGLMVTSTRDKLNTLKPMDMGNIGKGTLSMKEIFIIISLMDLGSKAGKITCLKVSMNMVWKSTEPLPGISN